MSILKQIEDLNLSPQELMQLTSQMLKREQEKSRRDAFVFADLLIATLRVAQFSDTSILDLAEKLIDRIKKES